MRKILLYIFFFECYGISIFSQNLPLKDSKFNLTKVIENIKSYDTIDVITYCLKFEKSKILDWNLGRYIFKNPPRMEEPDGENTARLERFSALFFIHKRLILKDTSHSRTIVLTFNGTPVYDVYMNNYLSENKKEKDRIIKYNLEESKKHDQRMTMYYNIVKKYVDDFKSVGQTQAKNLYLDYLKKNNIEWRYDYGPK